MPLWWLARGAIRKVAPLAFLGLPAWAGAAPLCPTDRIDEQVSVAHVFDGDTVALSDGRHVRLTGIDTPEVGHNGERSQPLAEEARAALESRLRASPRVGLRYDAERRDQYGRLLAHLHAPDGSDVAAEQLARGFASTLVVPPNTWNHECFARQEAAAREAGRGVWRLPAYRGVESTSLNRNTQGVHRVLGRVVHVGESRKSLWLDLEGGLGVRIPREDLHWFGDLHGLKGRRIAVRGRIYSDAGKLQMTIEHPSALAVPPP
jgi:endonuclease YncB( thermonuclease family)